MTVFTEKQLNDIMYNSDNYTVNGFVIDFQHDLIGHGSVLADNCEDGQIYSVEDDLSIEGIEVDDIELLIQNMMFDHVENYMGNDLTFEQAQELVTGIVEVDRYNGYTKEQIVADIQSNKMGLWEILNYELEDAEVLALISTTMLKTAVYKPKPAA